MSDSKDPIIWPGHAPGHLVVRALLVIGLLAFVVDAAFGFEGASLSILGLGVLRQADLRIVALGMFMREHQFGEARANTPDAKA